MGNTFLPPSVTTALESLFKIIMKKNVGILLYKINDFENHIWKIMKQYEYGLENKSVQIFYQYMSIFKKKKTYVKL